MLFLDCGDNVMMMEGWVGWREGGGKEEEAKINVKGDLVMLMIILMFIHIEVGVHVRRIKTKETCGMCDFHMLPS